jgi:hypothetical protein
MQVLKRAMAEGPDTVGGRQASVHDFRPIDLQLSAPARLCVVVDTEEEFDWSAPFSRTATSVEAIAEVSRLQNVLSRWSIKPTYVIDYPVATTPSSIERLASLAREGQCEIGAHLHPWVNPPFEEPVDAFTSYAYNLDPSLERRKIGLLCEAISDNFGLRPRVYKAGRYGFGKNSMASLECLGFDVDVSINPSMDFTPDGGPSFRGFPPAPAWFGIGRTLLEVPCTTGFIGAARRLGLPLHRAASSTWLEPLRPVGLMARSGLLNRVMLSPEGNSFDEMRSLAQTLHQDGLRTFALTLHSPSLKPGCTPYVRTIADRDAMLATIDRFCDFFCTALGGVPSTPSALFDDWHRGNSI